MKVSAPVWDAAGGVHQFPLRAEAVGALLACAVDVVGPDPEKAMSTFAVDTMVCLMEFDDLTRRFPRYAEWLTDADGHRAIWAPVPDHGVVPDAEASKLASDISRLLDLGQTVLLHCGAGYGRTGVQAVQILAADGFDFSEALDAVRLARPACGPQSETQEAQLERLLGSF